MAKSGRFGGNLDGLKKLALALAAYKAGRVDVGYFAGHSSRTPQGGPGSKPGFYKANTSKAAIAAYKRGEAPPDASTNPEIAAKMEFGIKGRVEWTDRKGYTRHVNGVPPRSTLRVPFALKGAEVARKAAGEARASMKDVLKRGPAVAKRVLTRLGIEGENLVQQAYDTRGFGTWAPNSPETIEAKGSDAPLIDQGELRRSVDSRVVG